MIWEEYESHLNRAIEMELTFLAAAPEDQPRAKDSTNAVAYL